MISFHMAHAECTDTFISPSDEKKKTIQNVTPNVVHLWKLIVVWFFDITYWIFNFIFFFFVFFFSIPICFIISDLVFCVLVNCRTISMAKKCDIQIENEYSFSGATNIPSPIFVFKSILISVNFFYVLSIRGPWFLCDIDSFFVRFQCCSTGF